MVGQRQRRFGPLASALSDHRGQRRASTDNKPRKPLAKSSWDDTVQDLSIHRLSSEEMVAKAVARQSRNRIKITEGELSEWRSVIDHSCQFQSDASISASDISELSAADGHASTCEDELSHDDHSSFSIDNDCEICLATKRGLLNKGTLDSQRDDMSDEIAGEVVEHQAYVRDEEDFPKNLNEKDEDIKGLEEERDLAPKVQVHTNENIEQIQAQVSKLQATVDQLSRKTSSLEQHQSENDKAHSALVKELNEFRDSQREMKQDMLNFQTQTQDALTKIMKNLMTILESKPDLLPHSNRRARENSSELLPEDRKAKEDTLTTKVAAKKIESIKPSRQLNLEEPKIGLPSYSEMRLADQGRREPEKHHDEIAPRSLRQVPKLVMRGRGPPNS